MTANPQHDLMRSVLTASLLATSCLWFTCPTQAQRQVDETPLLSVSDDQVDNIWTRIVPQYTRRMAEVNGKLVALPTHDPYLPSSLGKTVRDVQREETVTVRTQSAGITRTKRIPLSREEAEATALPLPDINPGHYGYIHSAEVKEIIGEDEMIISDIKLIDDDQLQQMIRNDRRILTSQRVSHDEAERQIKQKYGKRMELMERQSDSKFRRAEVRVKGFATRGLKEGQRWEGRAGQGLQIAVVSKESQRVGRRLEEWLLAVPTTMFGKPLDEEKFESYLAEREFTRERFAALVAAENERDRDEAMPRVFAALDKAKERVDEIKELEAKAEEMIAEQKEREERSR